MSKKTEAEDTGSATPTVATSDHLPKAAKEKELPPQETFDQAVDKIAAAAKKLIDSGVGGGVAGELAAKIYFTNQRGHCHW